MAIPANKVSKARRDSRRANWKLSEPGITNCPKCRQPKLAHRVCKECGYYDGKKVMEIKLKGKERQNEKAKKDAE